MGITQSPSHAKIKSKFSGTAVIPKLWENKPQDNKFKGIQIKLTKFYVGSIQKVSVKW